MNTPNGYSWFTTVTIANCSGVAGVFIVDKLCGRHMTFLTICGHGDQVSLEFGQRQMTGDLSIERVGPLNTEYTSTGTVSKHAHGRRCVCCVGD